MQTIQLLGIPYDQKSSFLRGPAQAPALIRQTLHNGAYNYCAENGVDILRDRTVSDLGDLQVTAYEDLHVQLSQKLKTTLPTLFLGGDHSVTFPIVKRMHELHGEFDILHFDAHGDLYDEFEGDRFSHACPFARIMEAGLAKRLVQVGVRTLNPHQREQVQRFGVEVIGMRDLHLTKQLHFKRPLYISIDIDGFDPAFAPGVSHQEAGGLTPRFVIDLLQDLQTPIIGADIVEFNPVRDHAGITAALCV
ncbi:MAG: agmatinase family protein, partial [Bacteroidota bacterium]